jgi:hypothetical protein
LLFSNIVSSTQAESHAVKMLHSRKLLDAREELTDNKVIVFQLPDDVELRALWIRTIRMKDYSITKNTVICINIQLLSSFQRLSMLRGLMVLLNGILDSDQN